MPRARLTPEERRERARLRALRWRRAGNCSDTGRSRRV